MTPRDPPIHRLNWQRAYRIIPSRFPPVGVFDAIADPADLDALYKIEALTNPRLREAWGELANVPADRRVSGPGTTPLMAAFTHVNPDGSRFSDGSYGVLYLAHEFATAIEETVYHRQRFLAATREPPVDLTMRCYVSGVHGALHDIRGGWPAEHDPASYAASRALGARLRGAGSNGIAYGSVRCRGGECAALFYPDLARPCVQGKHLLYRWDGQKIAQVLEVSAVPRARKQGE
ncbi:MAG: RES domain-containing protein [Rhodanobacteraceae bacterium]|nr:MAG: RES domain-containing protein [Rhodanobacteraceae bacterium]